MSEIEQVEEINPIEEPKSVVSSLARAGIWIFVLALLVIVAIKLLSTQQRSMRNGDQAPRFTLITFDGEQITPSDMEGKVVLVNFWASWCKPCEVEAEDLQEAWLTYRERGDVLFLGVDYVDTETPALAYIKKFDITYPNGPDLGTKISQAYRTTGVPETYIIDKQGALAYSKIGPFSSLSEITSILDSVIEP
jgi:cytochrome c biogenesis protein CcmG/thiol:disulfide interchange protein DsbE